MWYAVIVAVLSLAGAAIPLRLRPGHAQLQIYLSLAAGALLGAALFHLLPHSSEYIHEDFGLPAVLGVALVFFLQRYIAPHSHELSTQQYAEAVHSSSARLEPHDHLHAPGPFLTSAVAILALSIHSLFDGVALAAAGTGKGASLTLAVFLSVLIHKPMDGLSVSVLLIKGGMKPRGLWLIQVLYAALVPLGAALFLFTSSAMGNASPLIGYTLAFSAGTFLAIALTDLLPELHFHSHDRHKLSAALLTGLLVMWLTSLIGHGHHDRVSGQVEDAERWQRSHNDHP